MQRNFQLITFNESKHKTNSLTRISAYQAQEQDCVFGLKIPSRPINNISFRTCIMNASSGTTHLIKHYRTNLLVRITPGIDTYKMAVGAIMGLHFFCCTMTKTNSAVVNADISYV